MKFDDLRSCDACGEGLGITFHVVSEEHHVVNVGAAQRRLGMEQFFGGVTALASVFDAAGDDATKVASKARALLCESCWAMGRAAQAIEKVQNKQEAAP